MSAFSNKGLICLRVALGTVAGISLLLFLHNHALNLLPSIWEDIEPAAISVDQSGPFTTYRFAFSGSTPDGPHASLSRTKLTEDGVVLAGLPMTADVARGAGHGNWAHEPGQIIFSTPDGSDARSNGHTYTVEYPLFYQRWLGHAATAGFLLSVAGLYWLGRGPRGAPLPAPAPRRWHLHLAGATLLFFAGLYCSTGTLTPYANTSIPHVAKGTGYLYNPDHIHFHALFNFMDGRDRSTWDNALFLRRILYNVMAYPFMKAAGWEVGGTLASIVFNVAAFVIFVRALRRRVGETGAIFTAWILALYPGAGYWGGLPYQHALIVPGSLLLMLVLVSLAEDSGWRPVILGSVLLGLANLGYEFFMFFLPASLLLLVWQRRWLAAIVSVFLQALPLVLWILILKYGFAQSMGNSNSASFGAIAGSYLNIGDPARWRAILELAPEVGYNLFFGANFLFLPALFLAVVALNAVTSRIRQHPAELTLLLAGLALFLFNNLAPEYISSWQLRGTWIARIYQPVFPAFLWFMARWWQHLPALGRWTRAALYSPVLLALGGNALIVFGPILDNPHGLSEVAFYRFYDHANHANYTANLLKFGRRPLGFPAPTNNP
ncbi:MAG: Dolichyl-phosphate-mannose-protein mannosyltransferase [Verrucomicrobiota bacterium]|jgi:hypothetical protein